MVKTLLEAPLEVPESLLSDEVLKALEETKKEGESLNDVVKTLLEAPLGVPEPLLSDEVLKALEKIKKEGESLNGVIERLLNASLPKADEGPDLELIARYLSEHGDPESLLGKSPKEAARA